MLEAAFSPLSTGHGTAFSVWRAVPYPAHIPQVCRATVALDL